jgi:four helix bundle protein
MSNYKELEVWKQAIELAKTVYKITASFPPSEVYGLVSQMRRSAISVASNIAEGAARNSDKEFIQFLYIATGSVAELDTQYILSRELQFTSASKELEQSLTEIGKMLAGLIRHLKSSLES